MPFILPLGPALRKYAGDNMGTIILAAIAIFLGVGFGVLAVGALNGEQKADLWSYLAGYLQGFPTQAIIPHQVMGESLGENLKTVAFLWILGLSIMGVPIILLVLFLRGFAFGFTISFLVASFGWPGVVFAAICVIIPGLLIVPALLLTGAAALSFTFFLVKALLIHQRGGWRELGKMTLMVLGMSLFFMAAALYEGYLGPVLLRHLTGGLGI